MQGGSSVEIDDVFVSGNGGCRIVRISYSYLYPKASPIPGSNAEAAALWLARILYPLVNLLAGNFMRVAGSLCVKLLRKK